MAHRASDQAARAAHRLHAAHRELARARLAFADATTPSDPSCFDDAENEPAREALRLYRSKLAAVPGVVGFAVGPRTVGGGASADGVVALIVAVARKRSARSLGAALLPTRVAVGWRGVPIDVIEVGRFHRHAASGAGTRPGTSIQVDGARGTLGVFGRTTRGSVAITAMHLTGLEDFPAKRTAAKRASWSGRELGRLVRGTTSSIDAAAFSVDGDGDARRNTVPGLGQITRWRPLVPGDTGSTVCMRGGASGVVTGTIVNPCFESTQLGLRDAVLARIATRPGDSGAPLVDDQLCLLGFHAAGNRAGLALFSPAAATFAALRCDL